MPDHRANRAHIPSANEIHRGPLDWKIVSAVHGRGTLLLGPWGTPGGEITGAWVFAPPGVRLATPESEDPSDPPLSVFGWREAYWGLDGAGNVLIDHGRPADLHTCRLTQVIDHVLRRCPAHLGWVGDELERYVCTLHAQTRPDASGRRAPSAALASRTLRSFIDESEEALVAQDAELSGYAATQGLRAPRAGSLRELCERLDRNTRLPLPHADRSTSASPTLTLAPRSEVVPGSSIRQDARARRAGMRQRSRQAVEMLVRRLQGAAAHLFS
jgi:hypothetical protein